MVCVRRSPLVVLAAASLVLLGCGDGGEAVSRNAVSGQVTLNGSPLDAALVAFTPVNRDEAPTPVVARVAGGAFAIDAESGPKAGRYKVSVSVLKPVPRKGGRAVPAAAVDDEYDTTPMKESLPARYNARTELTADVTDAGPNHFDFLVTSR